MSYSPDFGEVATELAQGFSDFVTNTAQFNEATTQLVWDVRDRAEEALRRARLRQRVGKA
jgi:hypothetical protein